jgi:hypothetical protein
VKDFHPPEAPPPKRDDSRLLIVLFALLSILPFLWVIEGPFLFDDQYLIVQNNRVHGFEHLPSWFTAGFWDLNTESGRTSLSGQYFRPLVLLSYALDWFLGGGSSVVFHLSNLLYAGIGAALVMAVLLRWFGGDMKLALLAGSIFSLHPSKAESIAWIAGRPDLLVSCGIMMVLLGDARCLGWGLRGEMQAQSPLSGSLLQVLGTLIAFGAKEQAVVLPAFVLAQRWLFENSRPSPHVPSPFSRSKTVVVGGYLAVSVAYVVARELFYPFRQHADQIGGLDRLLLLLDSMGRYLKLLILPLDLSLFSAHNAQSFLEPGWNQNTEFLILGAIHFLLIFGLLGRSLKRRSLLLADTLLYAACLLPVSNLIPMGTVITVSPRFLFLGLLPLGVLVAKSVRSRSMRVVAGALLFVIGLGLPMCFIRASQFSSATSFWRYELRHNSSVPSVVAANAAIDEEIGLPLLAMARRSCGYSLSMRQSDWTDLSRLLEAWFEAAVDVIPHSEPAQVRALIAVLDKVLTLQAASYSFAGLEFKFGASRLETEAVQNVRAGLLMSRARLAARLGSGEGLDVAERALSLCPGCLDRHIEAVRVALAYHDLDRAMRWAAAASVVDEAIFGDRSLRQLWSDLSHYEKLAAGGDRHALLEFDLLVGNGPAIVRQITLYPELRKQASVDMKLKVARAAHQVGEHQLAETWLRGLLPDDDLGVIHEELMRMSPTLRAGQTLPIFVAGCATTDEIN